MFVQTRTEFYNRHAEDIIMGQNDISEDLDTFLDRLLEPSEAFARIFMNAYIDVMFSEGKASGIKANFDDVAQVSGALTTLTRLRLQQLSSILQQHIGDVEVLQPSRDIVINYEINGVEVKRKEPQAPTQDYVESVEGVDAETEKAKKRTQEIDKELEQERRKKQIRELLEEAPEFKKKQ